MSVHNVCEYLLNGLTLGETGMDHLHVKAGVDLHKGAKLTEYELYTQNSCDWLHVIKSVFAKRSRQNDPRGRFKSYGVFRLNGY